MNMKLYEKELEIFSQLPFLATIHWVPLLQDKPHTGTGVSYQFPKVVVVL